MQLLSVVIITYNEERNIRRCIESILPVADDIVVIDSFSTDMTEAICREYDIRFFRKEWQGYSNAKNEGNRLATYDWIFSIDADEALSEELQQSILKIKRETEQPLELKINRLVNYCGGWIKHGGWYPDRKLRFFDRRESYWEGMIHEKLMNTNEASAPLLNGDCYHYTYYTVEEHRQQTEKFTTLSALSLFEKQKKTGWTKRVLSPVAKFLGDFVFRGGFLDGQRGYDIARISAWSVYLKYTKLCQLYQKRS